MMHSCFLLKLELICLFIELLVILQDKPHSFCSKSKGKSL